MTAFATHPGAFSRESISAAVRNGFFTGSLKNKLRSQGKTTDIRHLLGSVRDDVLETTGGRQQPYAAGSLHGDLCLVVPSVELEPVRPACVLRFRAPACAAFNVPLFSFQIAVGFRASIEAGNLEALLRHLSSGESPSQMLVGDDFVFSGSLVRFFALFSPARILRSWYEVWTTLKVHMDRHSNCYHDACRRVHGHRYMLRASSAKRSAQRLC